MTEPATPPADLGLRLQPMVHVGSLAEALRFYEGLGGRLLFGSRDGDWAMVEIGGASLGLLAHPGDGLKETVELQFACDRPLEAVEARMRALDPAFVERGVADEAFGRMLVLRAQGGLLVKVVEVERALVE